MTIVQVASCQKKGQNRTYKVNFLCQKSTEFFYFLFSFQNINLGAHFWPKICPVLYYPSKTQQPILQYFTAIIRLLSRNRPTLA